ncbi:hypothetical protein C8Q77DRAFT_463499 [Trametes polyzona]|nr:hypothetical protein C8Q77DRAFT_463499 [Trametes polyzona]
MSAPPTGTWTMPRRVNTTLQARHKESPSRGKRGARLGRPASPQLITAAAPPADATLSHIACALACPS